MKYICQYCGKTFESKIGKTVHENSCKQNPNRIQKKYPIKKCQYCGKEFTVQVVKHHEETCECNPNKIEYHKCYLCSEKYAGDEKLHLEKFHNYNIIKNVFICPYCGNEYKQHFSLKRHINRCLKNPNVEKESKCHQNFIKKIKDYHPDLLNHIEILGIFYNGKQKTIKVKCKYCEEIYDEELNNIIRIGTWKCSNHCSLKIKRQQELNQRKENLITNIKNKNPEFLNRFEIIGDWDGQLLSKIQVKCKKCGLIKYFRYDIILKTSTYSCKGCTFIKNTNLPKIKMLKNEFINWLKIYNNKAYNKLDILSEEISLETKEIQVKCKECGYTWFINLYILCKEHKNILMCPNCNKIHKDSPEDYLISLIKSHEIINKKYICSYCNKEFKTQEALSRHEKICKLNPNKLIDNKIRTCPYCNKEFLNRFSFAAHISMCVNNPNWNTIKESRYGKN
jgi:hypothetical protein